MKNKLNLLIFIFGGIKLLVHFLTNTNYGLHRDEFLYFDEGRNLAWGFMEVPPLTPFIGKLADLLGGEIFAIRLFPALAGATIVILSGLLVKELGGKKWAVVFTCLALVLSPALLWTNTLFQPVSFNQLFWFLTAYCLIKIINLENKKYWYLLGISVGLGFFNKYSILFYVFGLIVAIGISKHRKIIATKNFFISICIATLIVLPNVFWQVNHNFPVMGHMQDLSQSQLVHINWIDYLISQISFHFASSVVWLSGLIGLFYMTKLKQYQFLGIALLSTVLLIGVLSGKDYYTAGAFLILFPFGGIALENVLTKQWMRFTSLVLFLIMAIPFLPYSLPVLKIDRMKKYCAFMKDNLGLTSVLRWEDGKYYELPQDMSDMNGWEELSQKVAKLYHNLPKEKKENCIIYGGGYAHASSLNYYKEKYELPRVHSFSSSYIMWVPEKVNFNNQILIDDNLQTTPSKWFQNMTLIDSIQNPNAREKGYIYYRENPKIDVISEWEKVVLEQKERYNLK